MRLIIAAGSIEPTSFLSFYQTYPIECDRNRARWTDSPFPNELYDFRLIEFY
jgi:hypothetical protein